MSVVAHLLYKTLHCNGEGYGSEVILLSHEFCSFFTKSTIERVRGKHFNSVQAPKYMQMPNHVIIYRIHDRHWVVVHVSKHNHIALRTINLWETACFRLEMSCLPLIIKMLDYNDPFSMIIVMKIHELEFSILRCECDQTPTVATLALNLISWSEF